MIRFAARILLLTVSASCLSVQDFGGADPAPTGSENGDGAADLPIGQPAGSDGTWRWDWVNPAPTGNTLVGISGTSDDDIWVAGDGGTVSHFDGTRWDIRHVGRTAVRYFAVGVNGANDVWVAGTEGEKISAVHFDGNEWVESYPFAGGAFTGFSHGTGKRLFAVVDWEILELAADGTWSPTDVSANGVFGPPVDVWVSSTGAAWALTTGAKLLHLPAGSQKWALQAPIGIPTQARGLALSGAGTKACAFYTGTANAGGGTGFLSYDGSVWHLGTPSASPLTDATAEIGAFGRRSACLADGSGILVDGDRVVDATPTAAPSLRMPADYEGEQLLGALSLDGSRAYAVGTRGGFLSRASGQRSWVEKGPTVRKDLYGVDVGFDGTVMLVDALQPTRSSGGEVLYWHDDALTRLTGKGFAGPDFPIAVTVVGADDAWVASSRSSIEITHWTGAWGLTQPLSGSVDAEPLAIWAPAKDDVWVTGASRCPDLDPLPSGACSAPVQGSVWHFNGKAWKTFPLDGVFRSIHGTGEKDVWFAGTGVAHWDGTALTAVASLEGPFAGVWASAPDRVWLWGDRAILYDGATTTPVNKALHTASEWDVTGIAESRAGDVFVLTKRATGTSLLWFDPTRTRLIEQISSDLELTTIRGRGDQLWAVGAGGGSLRFAPPVVH